MKYLFNHNVITIEFLSVEWGQIPNWDFLNYSQVSFCVGKVLSTAIQDCGETWAHLDLKFNMERVRNILWVFRQQLQKENFYLSYVWWHFMTNTDNCSGIFSEKGKKKKNQNPNFTIFDIILVTQAEMKKNPQ